MASLPRGIWNKAHDCFSWSKHHPSRSSANPRTTENNILMLFCDRNTSNSLKKTASALRMTLVTTYRSRKGDSWSARSARSTRRYLLAHPCAVRPAALVLFDTVLFTVHVYRPFLFRESLVSGEALRQRALLLAPDRCRLAIQRILVKWRFSMNAVRGF